MNNKGFTTIELVVSFTLTAVIILFLFQLVFVLKDLYVSSGIKIKLLTKQASINSMINEDFTTKTVVLATKVDNNGIMFHFNDETVKLLSYNTTTKTVSYGDYTTELISGSQFGNISISTEVNTSTDDTTTLNGILTIRIPIYHSLLEKEDFGINIVYLYNSNYSSISGVNLTNVVDAERQIYLIGDPTVAFENLPFTDPGYYVLNTTTEEIIQNDPSVEVTGTVDTSRTGVYYLTYTIYDMNSNIMSQVVRTVNVIKSEYDFTYTGNRQSFNVPINGRYRIEAWGASGGGTNIMSGKGGYTIGEYNLTVDDQLYIYVGGRGTLSTTTTKATGGFNGGGDSGVGATKLAGSGGGATDIRLNSDNLSSRIFIAGGGGGAGSRNDSTAICTGGAGGGVLAGIGTCSAASYLGGAGTSTGGGAAATYKTNIITAATAGTLGIGGRGASYSDGTNKYPSGGGGGGYYGGGGGARYGGGGGGSGYCGNNSCLTYEGTEVFTTTDGSSYEAGHTGNGYARITLLAVN